ncbi:hypothetical protein ACFX1W_015181 [Malus domestica]
MRSAPSGSVTCCSGWTRLISSAALVPPERLSRAAAEQILQTYNGTFMPNTEQNFRLNRATLGADERRQDDDPDFTVFVGDLAADVTDYMLQETFRQNYHSVKGARVVTDRTTAHQVPNPSSFHFIP